MVARPPGNHRADAGCVLARGTQAACASCSHAVRRASGDLQPQSQVPLVARPRRTCSKRSPETGDLLLCTRAEVTTAGSRWPCAVRPAPKLTGRQLLSIGQLDGTILRFREHAVAAIVHVQPNQPATCGLQLADIKCCSNTLTYEYLQTAVADHKT